MGAIWTGSQAACVDRPPRPFRPVPARWLPWALLVFGTLSVWSTLRAVDHALDHAAHARQVTAR